MKETRMARVNAEIQRQLAQILRELNDEFVSSCIISVLKVDTTPDLSVSKVFVSVLGEKQEQQNLVKYLNKIKKQIRYLLAHKIKLRTIPDLNFVSDDFEEKSRRVLDLFKTIEADDEG